MQHALTNATESSTTTATVPGKTAQQAYREAESYRRWVARQIGPRQVGGIYRTHYGDVYEVLEIDPGPREVWPTWQITVRTVGQDEIRRHSTAWDDRDQVLANPEDRERSAATETWGHWLALNARWCRGEAAELRHILDELAHPATTRAFQLLTRTATTATPTATEDAR